MNFRTLLHPLARLGLHLVAGGLAVAATTAVAQVGLTTLPDRDLPITLVYPTSEPVRSMSVGPFQLQVAPDAAPTAGARRLIVLSHGTGGSPLADHELAATLARAGFIVAQPLHQGDNHEDSSKAGPDSWVKRPGEVSRVIDRLARDPVWSPRLALDRVGVHGMSAGGVSALSLAGAQWTRLDLIRHCHAHAESDVGFCFSGLPDAQAQAGRRAAFERARGVPELLLPRELKVVHGGHTPASKDGDMRPDPRIASASVSVPVVAPFSLDSLARVRIPVGVVRGGRDTLLVPEYHSDRLLQACRACVLLADLGEAAHMDLLAPWPPVVARAVEAQQARGGRPSPTFQARDRSTAFEAIAAFHRRALDH
jgi:predicted dienelactone hydrolase